MGDRQRARRDAPRGAAADPRGLVRRQRQRDRGVPARLGNRGAARVPAAATCRRGRAGARQAARGAPPARRGDRGAARARRTDRERRQWPRARPGRPLRLRPCRGRLRRASTGDPRFGAPRLPAARGARRAGEGGLALAAHRSSGGVGGDRSSGRARLRSADLLRDARRRGDGLAGAGRTRANSAACRASGSRSCARSSRAASRRRGRSEARAPAPITPSSGASGRSRSASSSAPSSTSAGTAATSAAGWARDSTS